MTASFVAATSPAGELHIRKFDNETEARLYEISLWCYGWDTRPVLTLHDAPSGEQTPALHPLPAASAHPTACVVCHGLGCEFCPKANA